MNSKKSKQKVQPQKMKKETNNINFIHTWFLFGKKTEPPAYFCVFNVMEFFCDKHIAWLKNSPTGLILKTRL